MQFVEQVPFDIAVAEINALLDRRKTLPRRRQSLEGAIEQVAEAIQYGFVTIETDGSITQRLIEPVKDVTGNTVVLDVLKYKARVEPATINSRIGQLKTDGHAARIMVHAVLYTGLSEGEINKLYPQDRSICDGITLFFLV